MGKITKRARKFSAKGGVKAALGKGTVTKKGKLRSAKHGKGGKPQSNVARQNNTDSVEDQADDFVGSAAREKNLGDMGMEDFFAMATGELHRDSDDDQDHSDDAEAEDEQVSKDSTSDSDSDDSNDNSDDEEDVEMAEERMKAEMAKIEEQDPDFHKFLQENEGSLLEFGDEDNSEVDNTESSATPTTERDDDAKTGDNLTLTVKVLKSLYQGAFRSHSVKSLKRLISAYHSACHLADADDKATSTGGTKGGRKYIIQSSKVFDQLMLTCLNKCHEEFRYHLLGAASDDEKGDDDEDEEKSGKPIQPHKLQKSEKWEELRPIVLSFFRSTLHVMEEAKEPQLLTLILQALHKYLPFLSAFGRIGEKMLKSFTSLWSAPLDSSPDYQVVRLNAFFRIRQLALTQPFPFIESCLKKTYLAYARRARFGNAASLTTAMPTLTFMGNCLVELYSLDFQSSYQHAFVYIRQLALLLRGALQKKTTETFQQVFCWQFVHCLKLWTAVLAEVAPKEDATLMRSLVFPLVEIIQGVCRIAPSPVRLFPLRLHCVRLLQQLAATSESFIPTTSLLLECLDWKEWYLSPKKTRRGGAAAQTVSMQYLVKLGKDDALRTTEQLEPAMTDYFLLLQREIELYRYSAGFPEFSIRIAQRLKSFAKETRVARWRSYAKSCMETCDKYSAVAVQERAKLQEAPKDVKRLECIRPPSAPSMSERHQSSIDMESKALRNSQELAPTPSSASNNKRKQDDDDDAEDSKTSGKKESKATKKRRKKREAGERSQAELLQAVSKGNRSLDQADEVNEGIEWSDDE